MEGRYSVKDFFGLQKNEFWVSIEPFSGVLVKCYLCGYLVSSWEQRCHLA